MTKAIYQGTIWNNFGGFRPGRVVDILQAFHDTMTEVTGEKPILTGLLREVDPTDVEGPTPYSEAMREKYPPREFNDINKLTTDIGLYGRRNNKPFKGLQKIEARFESVKEGGPKFHLVFNRRTIGSDKINVQMTGTDITTVRHLLHKKGIKFYPDQQVG